MAILLVLATPACPVASHALAPESIFGHGDETSQDRKAPADAGHADETLSPGIPGPRKASLPGPRVPGTAQQWMLAGILGLGLTTARLRGGEVAGAAVRELLIEEMTALHDRVLAHQDTGRAAQELARLKDLLSWRILALVGNAPEFSRWDALDAATDQDIFFDEMLPAFLRRHGYFFHLGWKKVKLGGRHTLLPFADFYEMAGGEQGAGMRFGDVEVRATELMLERPLLTRFDRWAGMTLLHRTPPRMGLVVYDLMRMRASAQRLWNRRHRIRWAAQVFADTRPDPLLGFPMPRDESQLADALLFKALKPMLSYGVTRGRFSALFIEEAMHAVRVHEMSHIRNHAMADSAGVETDSAHWAVFDEARAILSELAYARLPHASLAKLFILTGVDDVRHAGAARGILALLYGRVAKLIDTENRQALLRHVFAMDEQAIRQFALGLLGDPATGPEGPYYLPHPFVLMDERLIGGAKTRSLRPYLDTTLEQMIGPELGL